MLRLFLLSLCDKIKYLKKGITRKFAYRNKKHDEKHYFNDEWLFSSIR